MQIVIDIPKYVYDTIVASDGYIADCDNEKVGMAVKNGTPLPKVHGDLIDKRIVLCEIYEYMYNRNYSVGHLYDVISEKTAVIEREE